MYQGDILVVERIVSGKKRDSMIAGDNGIAAN